VQHWRFIVLDSPEMRAVVQQAADAALKVIEPIYGMSRPDADDTSRHARNNRATYELHDLAGQRTSVLFVAFHNEFSSDFLQGASIFPALQNFNLAARAQGLGACPTSWAAYAGEQLMREAIGVPDGWVLAGHVVVGWPRGHHGPVRRRPVSDVVFHNGWDPDRADIIYGPGARPEPKS
jgi:nitroreductase